MRSKPAAVRHQKADIPVGIAIVKQILFIATALAGFILEFMIELPFMGLLMLHARFVRKRRPTGVSDISGLL